AAVAGLLALFAVWKWWPAGPTAPPPGPAPRPGPADPRLTFATPYRNVRPDVKYVSDAACADCHPKHARTYRQHPMGRSLAPVAAAAPLERYDAAAHNPFRAGGFLYRVERRDGRTLPRETAPGPAGGPLADLAEAARLPGG